MFAVAWDDVLADGDAADDEDAADCVDVLAWDDELDNDALELAAALDWEAELVGAALLEAADAVDEELEAGTWVGAVVATRAGVGATGAGAHAAATASRNTTSNSRAYLVENMLPPSFLNVCAG